MSCMRHTWTTNQIVITANHPINALVDLVLRPNSTAVTKEGSTEKHIGIAKKSD